MRQPLIISLLYILFLPSWCYGAILFQESFDDSNLISRGWYDASGGGGTITSSEHLAGSTASFGCLMQTSGGTCAGGTPKRHKFTPTNSVYFSFWEKHSSNWSSARLYAHVFYVLTTEEGDYAPLAADHLTSYYDESQLSAFTPELELQDALNIDPNNINVDLTQITENRASQGCNGLLDTTQDYISCYLLGSTRVNERIWKSSTAFTGTAGPLYMGDWHFMEIYFQLNSISNGIGSADGIMQMWIDGNQVINKTSVSFRTGVHPTMQFNQIILSPSFSAYPVNQTFWIDELTVATSRPQTPPSPPTNLKVQ